MKKLCSPVLFAAVFAGIIGFGGAAGAIDAPAARSQFSYPSNTVPAFPLPQFEPWPEPPPFTRPAAIPPAPASPSGVEQEMREKKLYSFRAENLDLKTALALFGRANGLNIVPDLDVTGAVTLDVHNLPLDRVMQALLEAHDVSWTNEQGLIRVHARETRMFSIDYLRLRRAGIGASSATLSSGSGSSSASSGGAGGGLGGGGGVAGGGAGGGLGSGGSGVSAAGNVGGSSINLQQENTIDFWKELQEQLEKLLTQTGRETLAINRTAGLIQVTDRPSVIRNVGSFLAQIDSTIARQVDIEAKLYDVTLGDQFQFGIDWVQMARMYGGTLAVAGTPTVMSPAGGAALKETAFTMLFSNRNTRAVLTALQEQGKVSVISQPRLRTLNNQTALIKVGTDTPFFSQNTTFVPNGNAGTITLQEARYQVITVGTILSITPQIATNGWITLDVSPVITGLVDTKTSIDGTTTAPVLDIKQASTIVRVNDGETIIIGGLIQNSTAKTTRKIPWIGDIPYMGKLFQGKFSSTQKKELVIFLTPRVVP